MPSFSQPLPRATPTGLLLICLASFVIALPAEAAICTFDIGPSQWGPLALVSGAGVDCPVPDGNDQYVIPAGADVTVVSDIDFDTSSLGRITVESGGSLVVDAINRAAGPGRIRLAVSEFLTCEAGSTCQLRGAYRQTRSATPTPVPTFEEAGFLETDQVLPCPGWNNSADRWESDCDGSLVGPSDRAGSINEVGLIWPHSEWATPNVDPRHTLAALDAMESGDVLCWADEDPSTPTTSTDENYCYEISLVDGAWDDAIVGVGVLIFDIRQTNPLMPRDTGYPMYLRQITESNLLAPLPAASQARRPTLIEVPNSVLPGTSLVRGPPSGTGTTPRRERVGMFIRFADSLDTPRTTSHRLSRTWNNPPNGTAPIDCSGGSGACDILEIYDPRGLPFAQSTGDRFWIDYGHSPNEHFFVFAPVHFTEADGIQNFKTRALSLAGAIDLRAVIVEDTHVSLDGAYGSFEDVWIRDPFSDSAPNASLLGLENISNFEVKRFSSSGGAAVGIDGTHGIVLAESVDDVHFFGVGMRHTGDDFLSSTDLEHQDIRLERFRAQFASGDAASMEFASDNGFPNVLELNIKDAECVQCNSNDAFINSGSVNTVRDHEADGFLRWGTPGFYGYSTPATVTNFLSVGSDHNLPWSVDRFVVAAADDFNGSAGGSAGLIDDRHQEVRNGIIRDYSRDGYTLSSTDDGILENILFLDIAHLADCTTSECRGSNLLPPATQMTMQRVSFATRPDSFLELDSAIRANSVETLFTIEGLLVQGMTASTDEGLAIKSSTLGKLTVFFSNTSAGPCFSDNVDDVPPTYASALPSTTVQAENLGLTNEAAARFDPIAGGVAATALCGIRGGVDTPGIDRFRWIHSISHIVPEVQADDPDADGVPSDPAASPCEDEEDERCADNCPLIFNPSQTDWNGDGDGDACSPQCSNGIDDDGDGLIDFGNDPECQSDMDNDEVPEPGFAAMLAAGLVCVIRLGRLRRVPAETP